MTVHPTIDQLLEAAGQRAEEQGVPWNREAWATALPEYSGLFDRLQQRTGNVVFRAAVYELQDGPSDELLVAAMVWGFGPTGYGASRTREMFEPRNGQPLVEVLDEIRTHSRKGADAGFVALFHQEGDPLVGRARLPMLSTAFGTKYLHFAAHDRMHSPDSPEPLVYDALVSKSIHQLENPPNIPASTSYIRGEQYLAYCQWAQDVANGVGCTATDVEHALFRWSGGGH